MAQHKPKPGSFEARWLLRQHACGQSDLGPPAFFACGDSVLPAEAAPFLCFEQAENQPRIWEVFGPQGSWTDQDKARVADYRIIGSDGCGNPIGVEDKTGAVWMLDHEDRFRTRQFVNSSVSLLAESLLAGLGEQDPTRLLSAISQLDPPAIAKNTFWDEAAFQLQHEVP